MNETLTELLKLNRDRRFRTQEGHVVRRRDGWFLRYYTDDPSGQRSKVTEKLCELDATKQQIRAAKTQRMKKVNQEQERRSEKRPAELTIDRFWTDSYLPFIRKALRPSTVIGYERTWSLYLCAELTGKRFEDYQTKHGTQFLTRLVEKKDLNRTTLHHVKWLGSAIYKHAGQIGSFDGINPWKGKQKGEGAVSLMPARAPEGRPAYELDEVYSVLKALPQVDQKLFVAIGVFCTMRPEEIAALLFSDVEGEELHVQRAAPYGILGPLKTEQSKRRLLITEPVKSLLAVWRAQLGGVTEGWIFPKLNGRISKEAYINRYHLAGEYADLVRRHGLPVRSDEFMREPSLKAKEVCPRWKGVAACRNTGSTQIEELTGDVLASCATAGNAVATQARNYLRPSMKRRGHAGQRALEAAFAKEQGK